MNDEVRTAQHSASSTQYVILKKRLLILLVILFMMLSLDAGSFATLKPKPTETGYLTRLLINAAPFSGERGWQSESNTKATILLFSGFCILGFIIFHWDIVSRRLPRLGSRILWIL